VKAVRQAGFAGTVRRPAQSLISGGRLVVADRSPKPSAVGAPPLGEHEISADQVEESESRQAGFGIVRRRDDFIERDPENE